MRRSFDPMGALTGSRPKPTPWTIVSMSLRLAIPWRVGLHQSPPPLHQPMTILERKKLFEQENPLSGKCANRRLSQPRGSPHSRVPKFVPTGESFLPFPFIRHLEIGAKSG